MNTKTIYAVQEFFIGEWSDISGQHRSENKALMESKYRHQAAVSTRPVRLIERIETVINSPVRVSERVETILIPRN